MGQIPEESATPRFWSHSIDGSALPAALAFALFVTLGVKGGGVAATVWYLGALFMLGLTGIVLWARGGSFVLSRAVVVSLMLFGALTGWTYLSILWGGVRGDAWDGANRTLLYLVVYTLFVTVALRAETVILLLTGFSFAIAVAGMAEFVSASRSAHPDSYFLLARFSAPTGYQNANAALFSIAFWPAAFIASRRSVPPVLRALMMATAGLLVELSVLSQSRAWLAAMPIVFIAYAVVVPRRVRSLLFLIPIALTVVVARQPLLHVFTAVHSGDSVHAALRSARMTMLVSIAALLVVGLAIGAVDHWLRPGGALACRLHRAGGIAFATVAFVGVVVGLAWLGNPVTRAEHAWNQFKAKPPAPKSSYFSLGFGSNRYDLWRVAAHEIARHPLIGVGSDNFAVDYLRLRRTSEEPLYPHSIELKVLAQTGIIGAALFAGFLGTALLAWFRGNWIPGLSRGVRAAALIGFVYWLVHGSVDWFWETPALGAPGFALLGLALSTGQHPVAKSRPERNRGVVWVARGSAVLVGAFAVVTLAAPWLAAEEVKAAAGDWRHQPRRSVQMLRRARELNPLSDEPDLIAGAIASRLGQTERMASAFREAISRNPSNWYAHFELGVATARSGNRRAALRELAVARELDPREPTIPLVITEIRKGRSISTKALDEIFLLRTLTSSRARR